MPLAHTFERAILNYIIQGTGEIGFYHGNMFEIIEDMKILKPTAFLTVPRILNRVYEGIKKNILMKPKLV